MREDGPSNLIFGHTWEKIQDVQQKRGSLHKLLAPCTPIKNEDILKPNDIELLETHGVAGLKSIGFFGVLDRLKRAGVISE